ncbi:MAG: DNA repair exonuclease, partial [Acetatifactor sp.]|nr:DNA repair exonuclease [Acetatifactor sp.]
YGVELSEQNKGAVYASLVPDADWFNIVMLHGQEAETGTKDKAEVINLRALKNKGIDYLALGHVHAYKEEKLDGRGFYCYPGCLEGRGFDECGEHGFVLLDIDASNHSCKRTFVPFALRNLYTVDVDVTDSMTSAQIREKIREELIKRCYETKSLLKIVLCGTVDVECEKNLEYLKKEFEQDYYFVKIYDETTLSMHYEDYRLDRSLKGEFVRTVEADDSLSESDRMAIIRYGLQLIAGEELV